MSEVEKTDTPNNDVQTNEPVVKTSKPVSSESAEQTVAPVTRETAPASKVWVGYVAAVVVVGIILAGVLYLMEKQGRSSTSVFESFISSQEAGKAVATVNGNDISNAELNTSIQQFSQAAAAQGVDLADPEAQGEIRSQSLEVLINTQLLKQAALDEGVEVSSEVTEARLAEIETQIGGPEVLAERMATLGIDEDKLQQDIHDELLIQGLLDQLFAEADIEVTEEEIIAVYESAGGEAAGLPSLEEVRPQVEEQIRSTKEQEIIDAYLNELKESAEIEIL